jgi:hypothetical protein
MDATFEPYHQGNLLHSRGRGVCSLAVSPLFRLALRPKDASATLTRTLAFVFIPGSPTPFGPIERAEARLLVSEGHAEWKNRCNDIVLLKSRHDIRGGSCAGRLHSALVALAYSLSPLEIAERAA